jgi:hypothetical protein
MVMTCRTVKGIVGKVVFFIKSTICVLANNADWDCFHNLWGWCSYLVMGSQEIGYGYTFHYIKKEKYLSELSRETLYRDPRKKKILLITSSLP